MTNKTVCFLDWVDQKSPDCNQLGPEQMVPGQACNCNDSWSKATTDFTWQHKNYQYISFTPASNLISRVPNYTVLLQAFFTCMLPSLPLGACRLTGPDNLTQSVITSSQKQSPTLYLAVYDPSLNVSEALRADYTRMTLINANSITSINLRLVYRQGQDYRYAYDYSEHTIHHSSIDSEFD